MVYATLRDEVGNPGSPHRIGQQAKAVVHRARDQIGRVVNARRHEIVFTSGATESNNLALLGIVDHAETSGKRHVVASQIEHQAVLEPLRRLTKLGLEVTLVPPERNGRVDPQRFLEAVRADTVLITLMQANNETGVRQPIEEVAEFAGNRELLFHVDAAQGFGKDIEPLRHPGIDLISISGHKIYGPQGMGALVLRRRGFQLPPLTAIQWGGGQELGLRPGTLPVHLIAGFGMAAELALTEAEVRATRCEEIRAQLLTALAPLDPIVHGAAEFTQPHVLNVSIPGVDADLAIEELADVIAVSNGSACTTICDTVSHVLLAMQIDRQRLDEALRFSWYHDSQLPDLTAMVAILRRLRSK